MGCSVSTMMDMKDQNNSVCVQCCKKPVKNLTINMDIVHSSHSPYLGSFFFASSANKVQRARKLESQTIQEHDETKSEPDFMTDSTVSSDEDQVFFSGQDCLNRDTSGPIKNSSNTLPSFRKGCPLHLKIIESYRVRSSGDVLDDDFSYDPDLNSGEYIINTRSGASYGGGLRVKLGAQFSWLADQWGRVLAATWSRQTNVPSHIIYSAKPFFVGQPHSTQRSVSPPSDRDDSDFRLYPWALLKKEGLSIEDGVNLYLVDENASKQWLESNEGFKSLDDENAHNSCGSFFCKQPSFRSQNTFHDGIHSQTIVSRIEPSDVTSIEEKNSGEMLNRGITSIPCSFLFRDPFIFDAFDATIAPGIDPLLIICFLTVHTRMDLEIMLSLTARVQSHEVKRYKSI